MDKLFYYSKSKDVNAGKGKNEVVSVPNKYEDLNKIKNWRQILSNFHEYPFTYNNFRYNTIEHCFQSQKIKLVSNEIAHNFTIDSGHIIGQGGGEIARKNRKVVILNEEQLGVWDENKDMIIKDIPKETFENIFKGSYNRSDIYVKKTSSRKKKIKNYL